MDDLALSYTIHYVRLGVPGIIWDRDSHEENLPRIEAACQQAAESKDYHFFDMLGHAVDHTRDRLAPPSSVDFKLRVKALVGKYGPKGNEGVKAQEKNRFANFVRAMQSAGGSAPEAQDDG